MIAGTSPTPPNPEVPAIETTVDVVIPVYGGLRHVRPCLEALHRWTRRVPYRLIVVDDASDERTRGTVKQLVADGWGAHGEVLTNRHNVGFLQTANRGMKAGSSPAVLLLNSDALPTPGWLEGLLACLHSDTDVGLVSPVSNFANLTRIDVPYGIDHRSVAEAVRHVSPHSYPEVGLASGFCMLGRRQLLTDLGYFDEGYGRGYFEESDLSLRAAERGWRVLADDATYVHHHGWGSFGAAERNELMQHNAEVFRKRWGNAHRRLQRRVRSEQPFAELERRLAVALQGRAQVAPRRSLPRSGSRSTAERARLDGIGLDSSPREATATSGRHPTRTWQRIARQPTALEMPADAGDALILLDALTVDPWTTDAMQLADRLARAGFDVGVATSGTFDPALFVDPCGLRPWVLTGPDELVSSVRAHRVVVATSPATVYDALLLRDRDGSAVVTWFDAQSPAPALGWPGDGWATALSPLFAQGHLGAAVPEPVAADVPVHRFDVGVDLDVYTDVSLEGRPVAALVTHGAEAGPRTTAHARAITERLVAEGAHVTVYGDPVGVETATVEALAPQSVEASILHRQRVVVEGAPIPGMERFRLRCAASGTPIVLASPVGPTSPLRVGKEAFAAPRGDEARAVEVATNVVRRPAAALERVHAARQRAATATLAREAGALAEALRTIMGEASDESPQAGP
jgi:GT2 family glycosyltransferase